MVGELDILNEWIPEQMQPGTVFVLENAGEIGEKEDPYWAVLACPSCGMLGLITRQADQRLHSSHLRLGALLGAVFHPRERSGRAQTVLANSFCSQGRAQRPLFFPCFYFLQLHRHLLDNFNSKSFERGHFFRPVGQQADAAQVQVRENLCADPDFALGLAFDCRSRDGKLPAAVEAERGAVSDFLDRKSLRRLV